MNRQLLLVLAFVFCLPVAKVFAVCTISVSGTQTNVTCHGGTNGAIDVSVSGAQGSVTYLWNDGTTTQDRAGIAAGTYTVTATDASNCTASTSFNISQPAALSATITGGTTICNGDAASLTVTFTGGTSTYSFTYNDGSLHTINNVTSPYTLNTGALVFTKTFTLTNVTDANACIGTITGTAQTVTVFDAVNSGTLADGDQSFCTVGDPSIITLNTPPSGGAGTFAYQWYFQDGAGGSCPTGSDVTGWTAIAGATNNNYDPPSGLNTSRTYALQVDATGSPDCGAATWVSGCRKVTINSNLTPSISISVLPGSTVCAGTYVTIVATATNTGGGSVNYNFKVNNVSQQNGASDVYVTNSLVNNDAITCDIMVTGGSCLATNSASSNSLSMTVNSNLTPSVDISASPASTICAGTNVTFTATASTTGGGSVSYNFKVNNVSKQNSSSNSYSTTTLQNNDVVVCEINVTGGNCLTSASAVTPVLLMTVNQNLAPTVSISASTGSTICAGTNVTFTATASNTGGGTVNYNFKVNNVSQQNSASNSYTTATLINNDVITCDINVSSGTCLTATTATSNAISMVVNSNLTPSVSITASINPVCAGKKVKFTATADNIGGGSVNYNFMVNNVSQQSGSSNKFTSTTLSNNDVVICEITVTGGACLTTPTASSNIILMTVNSSLTPTVAVSASPGSTICAGSNVTFTAAASGTGGGSVIYNFKVNNVSQQNDTLNSFNTSSLANGDVVTCDITVIDTSAITCLSDSVASSLPILMTVNQNITPTVSISALPNDTICAGSSVSFTATATNTGGGTVNYNFKVNSVSQQNGASNSFTTSSLANNDVVSCEITVTSGLCLTTPTSSSNIISITVNQNITPTVSISVAPYDTVCAGTNVTFTANTTNTGGGSVSYNFKVNNVSQQNGASNSYSTNSLVDGDEVKCIITVSNGICLLDPNATSNKIEMTINPIPIIDTVSDTTFCNGFITSGIHFSSNTDPGSTFYTWTSSSNFGFGTSGTGDIPSFNAFNSDVTQKIDTINVFPTAKGCVGTSTSFTITVNPTPKLTSDTARTICDNSIVNYTATSATPGVIFQWKRSPVAGISNPADSADVNVINETLHNTTDTAIIVIYEFTLTTADSICPFTQLLKVTVNPSPKVDFVADKVYCHEENTGGILFSSQTPGSVFFWSSSSDIGFGTSGEGNIPNSVAINSGIVPVIATVTVYAKASADSCQGPDSTFTITVNPKPTLKSTSDTSVCSGNQLNYSITSFVNGCQYSWSSDTAQLFISGNTSHAQSNINLISDLLIDSLNDVAIPVVYDLTLYYTANGKTCITDTSLNVKVNPSPPIPHFSNLDTITVCGGSENINFNVAASAIKTGESFHWSASPASEVDIRNDHNPNTVITFGSTAATVKITVVAYNSSSLGGCPDSASQIIIINPSSDSISERKIILKQPGNLLVYPDNSLDSAGYQWGYDLKINDTTLGSPVEIHDQVYQVFVPASTYLIDTLSGLQLDTFKNAFWVSLKRGDCNSKVYYNGPYAMKKLADVPEPDPALGVNVFPNPSSGGFYFTLHGKIYGDIKLKMYNALGAVVYQTTFLKKTYEATQRIADLGLPGGIYLLELLSSDHQKLTSRISISNQ